MKRFFTFLLACLYLTVSTGMAVQIHHCMGQVSNITIVPSDKDECEKCGMEKAANKCCKDEMKLVKIEDSYKPGQAHYLISIEKAHLAISPYYIGSSVLFRNDLTNDEHTYPYQGRSLVDLTILYCTLRV